MDWIVFSIWSFWDTLLTAWVVFTFWLVASAFGNTLRSVLLSGTAFWAFFFVLFWVGMFNMGLTELRLARIALVLAWVEMIVACFIASKLHARTSA